MYSLEFKTVTDTKDFILIRADSREGLPVVVDVLRNRLGNRRLFYIDSRGDLAEIKIAEGKFAGLEPRKI
ncbi:MAG: hypothetical protein DMF62_03140 [Acidobacteria bacterium]|nr:MAG: hypothetical protein DMF62_03140 [Acidobacteriota bacterium]